MDRVLAVIILVTIAIIGLWRLLSKLNSLRQSEAFVNEYATKLDQFAGACYSQNQTDQTLYIWLTKKVTQIHEELGSYAIMTYRPAFANYMFQNYPILINTLPKIMNGTAHRNDVNMCLECLIRYSGALEDKITNIRNNLKNPFIWIREGIRYIVLFPIMIFRWLDIGGITFIRFIENSSLAKMFSGLIAIVTLLSALVTIVVGWHQFANWITTLFK